MSSYLILHMHFDRSIVMKETPKKGITVSSSLIKYSRISRVNRVMVKGRRYSAPTPFYSRRHDRNVLKDDVNGFSSTSDICFMCTIDCK
jgi:hypothetical protein